MGQPQFWMWTKRKNSMSSQVVASTEGSYDDLWEEQAFAEDAAGPLGGCVWPPRSYTCSFCRREFKSAQALGGHMNVHRRERARLKQCPCPSPESLQKTNVLGIQHEDQMVYNPNSDFGHVLLSSPSSLTRVSVHPLHVSCNENTIVPPFSSPPLPKRAFISSPPSWSTLPADRYSHISALKEEENNSYYNESDTKTKEDCFSMRLNIVQNEEIVTCKRQRTDATLYFFPQSISVDRNHPQSELLEVGPNSKQDLDLELRLGERPKVK